MNIGEVIVDVEDTGERSKGKFYSSPLYRAKVNLVLDTGEKLPHWVSSLKKRDLPRDITSYKGAYVRKMPDGSNYIERPLLRGIAENPRRKIHISYYLSAEGEPVEFNPRYKVVVDYSHKLVSVTDLKRNLTDSSFAVIEDTEVRQKVREMFRASGTIGNPHISHSHRLYWFDRLGTLLDQDTIRPLSAYYGLTLTDKGMPIRLEVWLGETGHYYPLHTPEDIAYYLRQSGKSEDVVRRLIRFNLDKLGLKNNPHSQSTSIQASHPKDALKWKTYVASGVQMEYLLMPTERGFEIETYKDGVFSVSMVYPSFEQANKAWARLLPHRTLDNPRSSHSQYIHHRLQPPGRFDPRSFRTKPIGRRGRKIITACPRGYYQRGKCTTGTEAQAELIPRGRGMRAMLGSSDGNWFENYSVREHPDTFDFYFDDEGFPISYVQSSYVVGVYKKKEYVEFTRWYPFAPKYPSKALTIYQALKQGFPRASKVALDRMLLRIKQFIIDSKKVQGLGHTPAIDNPALRNRPSSSLPVTRFFREEIRKGGLIYDTATKAVNIAYPGRFPHVPKSIVKTFGMPHSEQNGWFWSVDSSPTLDAIKRLANRDGYRVFEETTPSQYVDIYLPLNYSLWPKKKEGGLRYTPVVDNPDLIVVNPRPVYKGKGAGTYVWVRLGDNAEYEKFDNLDDATTFIISSLFEIPDNISRVEAGVDIEPSYTGNNYVSFYWGFKDASHSRDLADVEFHKFKKDVYEAFGGLEQSMRKRGLLGKEREDKVCYVCKHPIKGEAVCIGKGIYRHIRCAPTTESYKEHIGRRPKFRKEHGLEGERQFKSLPPPQKRKR